MSELICNTSVVQYLHLAGVLEVLRALGQPVTVPDAVVQELEQGRAQGLPLPEVRKVDWIQVAPLSKPAPMGLSPHLGAGELAVLSLGLDRKGAVLVLDDRLARRTAAALGLPYTGTLGVLLDAKSRGLVSAVRPILERLNGSGFRASPETLQFILEQADKTESA